MKNDEDGFRWGDREGEHDKNRRVKAEQERMLRKRLSHLRFADADELRGLKPRKFGH
jgi:hypothetical protein